MSSEERMKVLKMVADGILSIEEADKLLDTLNETQSTEQADSKDGFASYIPGKKARWIRIVVSEVKTGKKIVNLRLPSKLISAGTKIGAKFAPELEGVDTGELMDALNQDIHGKIIDVVDEDDGEHVEIFIE
jgi:hypothetical protein